MKNQLLEDYTRDQEILAAYKAAKAAGDQAGIAAARAAHKELDEELDAKGGIYGRLFRAFSQAKDCGNTYLDLNDCIWDRDVEGLISCMRENGIERFTFSSTWSSAVETAWLFTKNGCRLEGLVEINSNHKAICSDEFEKAHGYLFSL